MATWVTIPCKDLEIKEGSLLYVYTGTNETGDTFAVIKIADILDKIIETSQKNGLIPLEKRQGMTED